MRRMNLHRTSATSYDRPRRVPLLPVAAVAAALLVTGGVALTAAPGDPAPSDYDAQRAAVVSVLDDAIGESGPYSLTVTDGIGGEKVRLP